jgi:galactonate dehydratase
MRISEIEAIRVPPRWIFVRVRTDDGLEGWGEAIVPKRANAVIGAITDLTDNIRGTDAGHIEDIWQRMHRDGFYRGGPVLGTAAAAIEIALWDIKGKRLGVPVHELLGGPVRDRVRTYAWVGGDTPHDVVAHVKQRVEQGFTAVKMNATAALDYLDRHSLVDDVIARVASIRETFGPDLGIALDFHGRVHRAMARVLLKELEQFRLMWVEEAATPEAEDIYPTLRDAAGSTPLATGERSYSRWEFTRLLEMRAVDILQPDVSITGLYELVKICHLAEPYDVAVAPHCPNGPLSLAASLQAGYSCGNIVIQEQSGGLHYHQGFAGLPSGELLDYVTEPGILTQSGGYFERSADPGLGLPLDKNAVTAKAQYWRYPDPGWRYDDGRTAEW